MTPNQIERVGLDVGFGDVKAAVIRDKLSTISFPSLLGQAKALSAFTIGLNSAARRRATRLVYEDIEYFIGDDALKNSRTQSGRQDRTRIGSIEERVLALAALARLDVTEANIVTGLPVLWLDDRKKLINSLRGTHRFIYGKQERTITIHKVKVRPQPFGGFYAHLLDRSGTAKVNDAELRRTYACLDIGWNTTDLSIIKELDPTDEGGARVGVRDVIQIVSDAIRDTHGLHLKPHEVEQVIRAGQIEVFGQYHDMGRLVNSATTALAQQVVSTASELLGAGERMSYILIFGGGAAFLGQPIQAAFKNGVVLPYPALANAIGFCHFAQREIWD